MTRSDERVQQKQVGYQLLELYACTNVELVDVLQACARTIQIVVPIASEQLHSRSRDAVYEANTPAGVVVIRLSQVVSLDVVDTDAVVAPAVCR